VGQPAARLVRIPRELLHVELDFLPHGRIRDTLRSLLADLPYVPDASLSAQLIGPPDIALPALAIVARRVGQGLRDANLAIAHDRARLHAERFKLIFLDAPSLELALAAGDQRPATEVAVFVHGAVDRPQINKLMAERDGRGLVSFVATDAPLHQFGHWQTLELATAP
jgi:hypothetical protein